MQSRQQSPQTRIQTTDQAHYLSQQKHRVELDSEQESLGDLGDEPDARPLSELDQLNSLNDKQSKSKLCMGSYRNNSKNIRSEVDIKWSQRLEAIKKRRQIFNLEDQNQASANHHQSNVDKELARKQM
jgi:hypothetical protein